MLYLVYRDPHCHTDANTLESISVAKLSIYVCIVCVCMHVRKIPFV